MNAALTPDRLPVAVGITGASGALYGIRLVQCLLASNVSVHLVISEAGRIVIKEETDFSLREFTRQPGVHCHNIGEIGAAIASGSFRLAGTVVCPCSANTLGAIAQGVGDNLICRMGAVALKERWPLILVPRETPYSTPLLENMKQLSLYGADIIPASPSFYRRPTTIEQLIDTVIDRVLVKLELSAILPPWQGPQRPESEKT